MTFSISTLTQALTQSVEHASLSFHSDDDEYTRVRENLAAQFVQGDDALSLTGFDDTDPLRINQSFSTERQGGKVYDYLTRHLEQAFFQDERANSNKPAVWSAARQVVAQIGSQEFRNLLDDVVATSGIEVSTNAKHATEITALGDGYIEVRRTVEWDHARAGEVDLGKVKAQWAMTCGVIKNTPREFTLAAGVSGVAFFVLEDPEGLQVDALAGRTEHPPLFAQFLATFTDAIASGLDMAGLKGGGVQLNCVTEVADPADVPGASGKLLWRGWEASKQSLDERIPLGMPDEPTDNEDGSTLISRLLGPLMRKDAPQAKSSEYLANKFRFEYSSEARSVREKLVEEDRYALAVLESEETAATVKSIGGKLADRLEQMIPPDSRQLFFNSYTSTLKESMKDYPIPIARPESFDALLGMLRTHDDHVVLLSMIWPIFKHREAGERSGMIDELYFDRLARTKPPFYDASKRQPPESASFGNSKTIQSNLFSADRFVPFVRDIDFRLVDPDSDNPIVRKMLKEDRPYVSGLSGMANLTCKVLDFLDIAPLSSEGKKFCEAMGAFIVGSGGHSYYEVYKAFNFYAKAVTPLSTLDTVKDFWRRIA
jgi:hypothetical protein